MRRRWSGWLAPLLLAWLLVLGHAAWAQDIDAPPSPKEDPATLAAELDAIERNLDAQTGEGDPGLERRLQSIMQRSDRLNDDAQMGLGRVQQRLTALGAPPAATEPAEPPEIASERLRAQQGLEELQTRSRIASFLRVRAHQLLEVVAARQRAAVLDIVLMETPPPWQPGVWPQAGLQLAYLIDWLGFRFSAWLSWYGSQGGIAALLQAVVAALGAAALVLVLTRSLERRLASEEPSHPVSRSLAALRGGLVPGAAILAVLLLLEGQGWLTGQFGAVLARGMIAIIAALLGVALLRATRIQRPDAQPPESGGGIANVGYALMVVALLVSVLKEAALRQPLPPAALLTMLGLICGSASFLLLAPWLRGAVWRTEPKGSSWSPTVLRAGVAVLALAPITAVLFGRGVLATYLYNRTLLAIVLVWTALRLRTIVHELLCHLLDRQPDGERPSPTLDADEDDAPERIASYWACMLADIALGLVALRLLLQLLDIPQAQIDYWTGMALGDIQVGNAVISLPNIVLAICVLALGLFAAGRLRRWLAKHVLARSGMEIGLRTSIAAGAGYIGMVLAILAAIATAGISLSSVAIVAGALSVGMGFGLRTVVENFVAGLLMLIERPIRVGDWVVIGDTEGTVRRISVRATEIETFDSASVVVPNSLFVSSPVTNWTLQNRRGRIHVKVGVGYDSDPTKVQALLLECARANRDIAAYPAPQALFVDFGDSALLFELRCHVRDVDNYATARSDLLVAIETSLRANDIEVPYPQQVVHRGKGWEEASAEVVPPPVPIRSAS